MLTPKRTFQQTAADLKKIAELTATNEFQEAAAAALLELIVQSTPTLDPVEAAAGYQRIMGAKAVLNTLMGIANPPTLPPTGRVSGQLDHNAK